MRVFLTGNHFAFGEGLGYSGERILGYLTQELVKRGHEVHLFAREGTNIPEATAYVPVGPMNDQFDVHYKAVCDYVDRTGIEPELYFCGYFGKGNEEVFERWP